ncbi:MAG: hypothetical protein ACXV8O_18785 [Methylobacter sp.]
MTSILNKARPPSKHLKPGHIVWDIANEQQGLTDDLRPMAIGLGALQISGMQL